MEECGVDSALRPRLRTVPEDFVVEELPLYAPDDGGDHGWLWVEKRLLTTDQALDALARATGAPRHELRAAGRKDRVAVTRQWLSVPHLAPEAARELDLPAGLRVLDARRHSHKLRTGDLAGNRFRIVVRGVDTALAESARGRFETLVRRGLPNRFGDQRFGRHGDNAARGAEILRRGIFRGDRRSAMLLVSAFQSLLFNEILAARGDDYDRLLPGDLLVDHRSGLVILARDPEADAARLAAFEASPTAPLVGTKCPLARDTAGALERRILAAHGVDPRGLRPPRGLTVAGERRPLRARLTDATLDHGADALTLAFTLPAGSFATVLVEEVVPGVVDASRESAVAEEGV